MHASCGFVKARLELLTAGLYQQCLVIMKAAVALFFLPPQCNRPLCSSGEKFQVAKKVVLLIKFSLAQKPT